MPKYGIKHYQLLWSPYNLLVPGSNNKQTTRLPNSAGAGIYRPTLLDTRGGNLLWWWCATQRSRRRIIRHLSKSQMLPSLFSITRLPTPSTLTAVPSNGKGRKQIIENVDLINYHGESWRSSFHLGNKWLIRIQTWVLTKQNHIVWQNLYTMLAALA